MCVWEHQELKQVKRLAGPGLKQCGSTRERCSHGGFPTMAPASPGAAGSLAVASARGPSAPADALLFNDAFLLIFTLLAMGLLLSELAGRCGEACGHGMSWASPWPGRGVWTVGTWLSPSPGTRLCLRGCAKPPEAKNEPPWMSSPWSQIPAPLPRWSLLRALA